VKYGQHDWIIGRAKCKRGARITGFGRSLQQRSRRPNIALGHKLLAACDKKFDLVMINFRLCGVALPIPTGWRLGRRALGGA